MGRSRYLCRAVSPKGSAAMPTWVHAMIVGAGFGLVAALLKVLL